MGTEITYLDAIHEGLREELERDPDVVLLGEDIGRYGGAFKVTKGFLETFGEERVLEMPIAELGIVGTAIGMAYMGMKPVVEFQFIDFIACGFDQIVNFAATSRYRWGVPAHVVLRGPWGGYSRAGMFHSRSPEMWFAHSPGLKVVAPGTVRDAKGLIKAAIRDEDPVVFLEHKWLYRRLKDALPEGEILTPIGKANVALEGDALTMVTYGATLSLCLQAAKELAKDGARVEVLDLRTIYPLDRASIVESVKKTSKVMVVHEDTRTGGIAGEIAISISEEAFEHLDGPIVRVTAPDTPVPYAPTLEDAVLPSVGRILRAARKLASY
jgi:2-oxoisovalerate dehydrogenase E1 component beta subunit